MMISFNSASTKMHHLYVLGVLVLMVITLSTGAAMMNGRSMLNTRLRTSPVTDHRNLMARRRRLDSTLRTRTTGARGQSHDKNNWNGKEQNDLVEMKEEEDDDDFASAVMSMQMVPSWLLQKIPNNRAISPFVTGNSHAKNGKTASTAETVKSAMATYQEELRVINAKSDLSRSQRQQRRKRLSSRFRRWLMYQMLQPILEEQILKSVKSQFALIQMEVAMFLPEIYEFESVQTSRVYQELPDSAKPFFAQMVQTDRFFRGIAAAIRSGVLFGINKMFVDDAAMPMVRSVARSIVKNIKLPKLKDLFNIQGFVAEYLEQLHPVIMKRLDEESLDRILDFYAAQVALFGARGVQAFFVSALRSLRARQWRRQQQLLAASSSLATSLVKPLAQPTARSQSNNPLSQKDFDDFFTNQYSFLQPVEFEDYSSSDEEDDYLDDDAAHPHHRHHGHHERGFRLPEFRLPPKFVAIAEQFSHSLSVFAAETLQALLTGLMIAYSGLIKNFVRVLLAVPMVRNAILAFFELNVLRAYTVSFDIKRLPQPVCPMNQDVTMDNLWNGERREAERREVVENHQRMVNEERLAREKAALRI